MNDEVEPEVPDRRGHAGAVTLDLVAAITLTALVLVGFDDSYATRAYLVTGMVGVTAMAAWVLLCTVQGWGTGVFLLVASVAFPVLGATVVLHDFSWLGFPSVQGVADLLTATITAPSEFLTTIPPVDAVGTVLAIPYVVGFVLGGSSAALALRTRRPALPLVPLVAGLALGIGFGTEDSPALDVRSTVFAALTLVWVSLRSGRLRELDHAERGRTFRVLVAVAAATGAAVASSMVIPPVSGDARLVLRGRVGTGQDVSQLDNPLAGFRKFTDQPRGTPDNVEDKRLLKVNGLPRRDLLRIVALDTYDGSTWAADNRTVEQDTGALFQRIGGEVGARRPGHHVEVGVEVKPAWTSSWVPLAGQLTAITFDYRDGSAQRKDVRYNVATQTGMVVGGLQTRDDYTFTATIPDSTLRRSMRPYGSGSAAQPAGAYLDRYLRPWKESGLTPMGQVFSLAKYLRVNGRYSDGATASERLYLPGHSSSRLGTGFIGARSIVGDDEQYAAFMALAANRLGVPARVVVVARPDRRGWVRGRNVFAWVEVRVADGSWRTLPAKRYMSHKPPKRTDELQTPQSFVRRDARQDQDQRQRPRAQQPQPTRRSQEGQPDRGVPVLLLTVPFLVLLVGAVPALKWVRRRRRRRASRPSGRVVGGWAEVLDLALDLGRVVPPGLARTEQARVVGLSVELARQADLRIFAREEPTRDEVAGFWSGVAGERRRLLRDAGPVLRFASLWSLRSVARAFAKRRWRSVGLPRFRLRRVGS